MEDRNNREWPQWISWAWAWAWAWARHGHGHGHGMGMVTTDTRFRREIDFGGKSQRKKDPFFLLLLSQQTVEGHKDRLSRSIFMASIGMSVVLLETSKLVYFEQRDNPTTYNRQCPRHHDLEFFDHSALFSFKNLQNSFFTSQRLPRCSLGMMISPRADMLRWDRPSADDERLTMIHEPRTDLSVRPEKD
jgi:hypothetical protein